MDDVVDDSDGCFGMDTLVTTSSGNQKLMKDMKIGEEVLSDETGSMTKFIGWMELNSNTKNKMIEVETDDGEKLIMTDNHNVFSYEEDKPTSTYVKDLSPGNVLVGGAGKVQIPPKYEKIIVISFITLFQGKIIQSMKYVEQMGYLDPLTESGTIVTNNITSSCCQYSLTNLI